MPASITYPQTTPPKPINVHEAKTNFSKLLDRAHAGETILLGKGGKPYAKLVPVGDDPAGKLPDRKGGQLAHLGLHFPESAFDPMTDEELREWGLI